MATTFVETEHLTKRYRSVTALNDCTLQIEEGEVFGLLGPNGAGKTTLLRLMLGFLRPTQGSARIAGFDCLRQTLEVRRRTAYLPGDARLFRSMRGRDVLRFFTEIRPDGDMRRSVRLAERLELDLSRWVALMSTGMRQKLALAAAFSAQTPLIILDEPTSNLDPTVRRTVLEIVLEEKRQGRTVLFSSHVLSEVEDACDRVAILRRGELVHVQELADLRRRHVIQGTLLGELTPAPAEISESLTIQRRPERRVTIETPTDLAPLLGWLSRQPLQNISIERVRLKAVYEQFHSSLEE